MSVAEDESGSSKQEKRQLLTSNVSSIIALKSELIRKKNEQKIRSEFGEKPKKNLLLLTKEEERNRLEQSRKRQERIFSLEKQMRKEEEEEQRRKKILEEKSAAYTRLCNGQALATEDGQSVEFLVDFDAKKREDEKKMMHQDKIERKEAEENELVHYVPDEEQRVYGVSHVTFSQSESKRQEQIKKLLDLTKKTDAERQLHKEAARKKEEKYLERLNRIRKRKGLPEIVPEAEVSEAAELEYLDIPLPPEPQKQPEVKKTKLGVREWDRGKVGYMKWIEGQREERNEEFQPPSSYFNR